MPKRVVHEQLAYQYSLRAEIYLRRVAELTGLAPLDGVGLPELTICVTSQPLTPPL